MFKLIESLRGKKDSQKKAVALLASSSAALLIFFLWFSTSFVFSPGGAEGQKAEAKTPISSLRKSLNSVSKTVSGEFKEIKERFDSELGVLIQEEFEAEADDTNGGNEEGGEVEVEWLRAEDDNFGENTEGGGEIKIEGFENNDAEENEESEEVGAVSKEE